MALRWACGSVLLCEPWSVLSRPAQPPSLRPPAQRTCSPSAPQIGARMLAANRAYRVRISYLPAEAEQIEAAGRVRWLRSWERGLRCVALHCACAGQPMRRASQRGRLPTQPHRHPPTLSPCHPLPPVPHATPQVCTVNCDLCRLGQEHVKTQRAFREVSSRSLARRRVPRGGLYRIGGRGSADCTGRRALPLLPHMFRACLRAILDPCCAAPPCPTTSHIAGAPSGCT